MSKILVVDDDLVVLATISLGLSRVGHQVLQADSGLRAVQLCRQEAPDLAILDVRMPGMSGIEVALVLKRDALAPFIFLSAYHDEQIVQDAIAAGALGYLVKPVEISRIVPAIEVALARSDEFTQLEESNANLSDALNRNREVDIAIGLVMERYHLDRARAFETLRGYARNQRSKVLHIAQRLIDGEAIPLTIV
ncbi:MAG: response regulator [Nitrosomonadales bacterium]|nr:response regulator [Nitrosomonadales bacterium]